jgi:putative ABC transport system permease protein
MLLRILRESLIRRKRRKLIALTAITLGTGIATGLLSVAVNIGDKISRELKRYGANLILLPQEDTLPMEIAGVDYSALLTGGSLKESDLPQIKEIFWRHNILGFVPELQARAAFVVLPQKRELLTLVGTWFDKAMPLREQPDFRTGLCHVADYWQVNGAWVGDESQHEAMIGAEVARRFNVASGDSIHLEVNGRRNAFLIRGVVITGGAEEHQIFAPLAVVQQLTGQPGKIKKVLVSALTNPEDGSARKPMAQMSREEYDRWYCSPYASSIAQQLREAVPAAEVRIVRQVAEGEGAILRKISLLMFLIAVAIFCTSILGVTSTMTTTVLERRKEVGLFRALGAEPRQIAGVFLGEALVLGLSGGILGSVFGYLIAQQISQQIFGDALQFNPLSLPVAVLLAMLLAMLGSLLPLRQAFNFDPVVVLHSA